MTPDELSVAQTALARSTRALLLGSAATATVAAWFWLGASGTHGMHDALFPHGRPFEGRSFLYAVILWQAMTIAMMTPTFSRWLMTFAKLAAGGRRPASAVWPAAALASGYFAAWLGYSVVAAAIQTGLQQASLLRSGRLAPGGAGLLLIVAGLFQFAPVKRACLTHCRNPLTYFLSRWRNGPSGAFRLGILHGAYCVGCCWLLMMTGLAMGLMNMAWMAILTLLVGIEQILPRGDRIASALGIGIAGWGLALLLQG